MLTKDLENAGQGLRYTLYGSAALYEKCIGFCWYHHKWLTIAQLKKHKCLQKQCTRLEKREKHKYWIDRNRKKQLKKERKRNDKDLYQ